MNVFCISGSLREESSNTRLLHLLAQTAPTGTLVRIFSQLEYIPIFHPDKEQLHKSNRALSALRSQILKANCILISSPEYAHSLPGVLKNALDHLVASGEFSGKQVALVTPSLRGQQGQHALATVIDTIDARLLSYDVDQIAFPISLEATTTTPYLFPNQFWEAILSVMT